MKFLKSYLFPLLIMCLFVLWTHIAYGQTQSSDPCILVPVNSPSGRLYRGVTNTLRYTGDGFAQRLELEVIGAELISDGNIISLRPGNNESVSVIIYDRNINKKRECTFIVSDLILPTATFAGQAGDTISYETARNTYALDLDNRNCDYLFGGVGFKIISFTLEVKFEGYTIHEKSDSDRLTFKQSAILDELRKGKTFSFTKIMIEAQEGSSIEIEPLNFVMN